MDSLSRVVHTYTHPISLRTATHLCVFEQKASVGIKRGSLAAGQQEGRCIEGLYTRQEGPEARRRRARPARRPEMPLGVPALQRHVRSKV